MKHSPIFFPIAVPRMDMSSDSKIDSFKWLHQLIWSQGMVFEGISQYLQTTAASTRLTSHFLRLTLQPETAKPTDSTLLSVSRCAPLGLHSRPAQGETPSSWKLLLRYPPLWSSLTSAFPPRFGWWPCLLAFPNVSCELQSLRSFNYLLRMCFSY